jgi:hypothetical protein
MKFQGNLVSRALRRKAREGVEVRVMVDMTITAMSHPFIPNADQFILLKDKMERDGVKVISSSVKPAFNNTHWINIKRSHFSKQGLKTTFFLKF